ncbi:hypothetical protein AB8U03_13605 [Clostridium sp. Mt-5]|uniref:Uncharacterized protein n=1 Tax=Clostridium moutaii TaxID=3240932 RepID=A0ABV4BT40_9CLOT
MIEVSKDFKKAVYAHSRYTSVKIRFEILDLTAFNDNTKTATSQAIISRLDQVTNKIRSMDNKYAILEKDYLKLDGSFILPPVPAEMPDSELGWWSEALCDSEGVFNPYQVLEFDFNQEHSNMGITIYFDMLNNECASDFDIDVFDSSGNVLSHASITGNADSRYICMSQLSSYKKIVITVKKWCKPYRRAKIVEVDFGIVKEYEDKQLISMSLLQELDTTSSTLPADELKFTVDNTSKEFNVLNPQGFYQFLHQGQEVFTEIGVELLNGNIEFIQVGKHYLKEWQSDEGSMSATFTARDLIDSLSSVEIENSIAGDITLYDLAIEVLTASGITDYVLSDNLKLIHTKGLHSKMSYRNKLQLIAIAGMCVVYTDPKGTLHLKQLISAVNVIDSVDVTSEAAISNKDQIIDNVLEPSFKVETLEKNRLKLDGSFGIPISDMSQYQVGWLSEGLSDSEGIFQNQQAITLNISKEHSSTSIEILFDTLNDEYSPEFEIKAYDIDNNLIVDESISGNNQSDYLYQNNLIASSRKIEIIIKSWCKPYSRAKVSEISFDAPVDNITLYNTYSEPQIAIKASIKSVEVDYYPDTLDTKVTYIETDNNIKDGDTLVIENSLINTEEDAKNVAQWILRESNQSATFTIDWRQNPRLNLADKVAIENSFGNDHMAVITKQEYDYQGYLGGKTEAKGEI